MGVSENRGTLFWGPYSKDPTIWGSIFGSPIFGNSRMIITRSRKKGNRGTLRKTTTLRAPTVIRKTKIPLWMPRRICIKGVQKRAEDSPTRRLQRDILIVSI